MDANAAFPPDIPDPPASSREETLLELDAESGSWSAICPERRGARSAHERLEEAVWRREVPAVAEAWLEDALPAVQAGLLRVSVSLHAGGGPRWRLRSLNGCEAPTDLRTDAAGLDAALRAAGSVLSRAAAEGLDPLERIGGPVASEAPERAAWHARVEDPDRTDGSGGSVATRFPGPADPARACLAARERAALRRALETGDADASRLRVLYLNGEFGPGSIAGILEGARHGG